MNPALGEQPTRLPSADLARSFGPPDRSSALSGLLAPRPPVTEMARPPQDAPAAPPPVETRQRRTQPASKPAKRASDTADTTATVTVVVYIPASLRERLRDRAATTRLTFTDLVLEALDATHARLADLLAATLPVKSASGSLFSSATRTRRLRHDEPQVQVSIRPTRGDLDVIDRLAEQAGAPSRSALVTTALRAYLA